MIAETRQTALEAVECLFYRVTINVEAPLNVVLFKVVMRRMKTRGFSGSA